MKIISYIGRNLFSSFRKINFKYRDIKPENILFERDNDDSLLKIIDFGTAIELKNLTDEMTEFIGTV